jgi:cytidylate kinase
MHITLSGNLGSGKSTVCRYLEQQGFEIYSTGKILRGIARNMGLSALEMNQLAGREHSYDHDIDGEVVRIAAQRPGEKIVFDSRMAWHFVPVSLKIFLTVDLEESARRVFNDRSRGDVEHYNTEEETAFMLRARMREEHTRFKTLYGVDYLDMKNYDLVISTMRFNRPELLAEMILSAWEYVTSIKEGGKNG